MKETNTERVILNYVMGKTYQPKSDRLRLIDNEIYNHNTRIGYFYEDSLDGEWLKYLILPLQDFKRDPSWKKHKIQLAHEANKFGIRVVFDNDFDIGLGNNEPNIEYFGDTELIEDLLKVAKYSQDKEIKTAACTTTIDPRDYNSPIFDRVIAYSYNQLLNEDSWLHAEKAVSDYVLLMCERPKRWVTLLQPCEHCLKSILDTEATYITYAYPHKDKWNTDGYFELVDKLCNNCKRYYQSTSLNLPVFYGRTHNVKVNKFYERRVK